MTAASMPGSDTADCVRLLCDAIAARGAAALDERDAQRLLAALVRLYADRRETDAAARPFGSGDDVPATAVAQAATGMLEAADMAVFELGMWQTIKRGS